MGRAATLEWIVTSNEVEALLLEHNLIKQHRPPFNIRLRDDKSYPYIMITVEDDVPTGDVHPATAPAAGTCTSALCQRGQGARDPGRARARVFPVRTCRGREPGRPSGSPCLQFHIERCPGPCVGGADAAAYRARIDQVVDFLSGRETKVVAGLRRSMHEAAKRQDFESAAVFRDRLDALAHVLERQQIESGSLGSADITGLPWTSGGRTCRSSSPATASWPTGAASPSLNAEGAEHEEVFERFVAEYYSTSPTVPAELIVPPGSAEDRGAGGLPGGLRGTRVEVQAGGAGGQAATAADGRPATPRWLLTHERLKEDRSRERRYGALTALEQALGLEASADAHRRLRHLEPGRRGHRGVDGGVRRRGAPRRATTASSPSARPPGRTTWEPCARRCCGDSREVAGGPGEGGVRPLVRGGARSGDGRRGQGRNWAPRAERCGRPGWRAL